MCPFVNVCVDQQDIQFAKRLICLSHQLINLTELRDVRPNHQNIVTQLSRDIFSIVTLIFRSHWL